MNEQNNPPSTSNLWTDPNNDGIQQAVQVLRAVNHPMRRRIIRLLYEGGVMTVTQIYLALRVEQSVASQHLAVLRRAGVVSTTRDGKYMSYTVNRERLATISDLIAGLSA